MYQDQELNIRSTLLDYHQLSNGINCQIVFEHVTARLLLKQSIYNNII